VHKLSCEKSNKLIYLFWDGRLKPEEEEELRAHLSECERCQEKLPFLELVEGRAKRIQLKEPPQEYWDTFSSRVREKIADRKEKSFAVRLKQAFENILTFSPLKIKIAAGLVSILLVFIIGKLYVDYKGRVIIPSAPMSRKVEPVSNLPVPKIEKKKVPSKEESKEKIPSLSGKPQKKGEPPALNLPEGKTIPGEKVGKLSEPLQEEIQIPATAKVEEKKVIPSEKVTSTFSKNAQKEEIPSPAPRVEPQAPVETESQSEQPMAIPDAVKGGAGVKPEDREAESAKTSLPQSGAYKTRDTAQERISKDVLATQIGLVKSPAKSQLIFYSLNGNSIPQLQETDTLMQADTLTKVILVWRAYIEKNPTDSLSPKGYLQIATAYYLLAKSSQDTTIISQGLNFINDHIDQIKNPAIKVELNLRLEKIRTLLKK
jgi:hypothetical protein